MEEAYQSGSRPFAVPDFALQSLDAVKAPNLDIDLENDNAQGTGNIFLPDRSLGQSLQLPALQDLNLQGVTSHSVATESVDDSHGVPSPEFRNVAAPSQDDPSDDIWESVQNFGSLKDETRLLSWETFGRPLAQLKPSPAFISEAGPAVFDAALARRARDDPSESRAGTLLRKDAFLRSLSQLGLGRSSSLFPWDEEKASFVQAVDSGRPSGCSVESAQDVVAQFVELGNAVRSLRFFAERVRAGQHHLAAMVALAGTVEVCIGAIEQSLFYTVPRIKSFLQLQAAFEPARDLVLMLETLVSKCRANTTDEDVLETVYSYVQSGAEVDTDTSQIMLKVLARVAQPWLTKVESLVGLRQDLGLQIRLSRPQDTQRSLSEHGDLVMPHFLLENDKQLIDETNTCLRFLQTHHPGHLLADPSTASISLSNLEWVFSWDDLVQIQNKASKYEASVIAALKQLRGSDSEDNYAVGRQHEPSPSSDYTFEAFGAAMEESASELNVLDIRTIGGPRHRFTQAPDTLRDIVLGYLDQQQQYGAIQHPLDRPPLSLSASLSLHGLVSAQHRVLSYGALHALLHSHGLLTHFDLHHAFSLCSSGLFTARLSTVLFSNQVETAERQKGKLRTGGSNGMGLKLGTGERNQWPPASSEVSLALMGVLNESWREESTRGNSTTTASRPRERIANPALPGDLSFAIRTDLPPATIDRVLNQDSIAALDFLRLSYVPPPALASIFTPRALDIYDRIFALWLRLLRASAALDTLTLLTRSLAHDLPQILRLRHTTHHFLTTLLSHFRLAATESPWRSFTHRVNALAAACAHPHPPDPASRPANPSASPYASLAALTALHDTTLDTVAAGLLLRKRQRRAADALGRVCGAVLAFATWLRGRVAGGDGDGGAETVGALHDEFCGAVDEFVRACRGVVGDGSGGGGERAVEGLLEALEGGCSDMVGRRMWWQDGKHREGVE